jgi:SNF2 family DNA or RNA helicase
MGFFGEDIKGLTKNEFHVAVLHKLLSLVAVQNPEMNLAKGKKEIIQKVDMVPKQRKLYKDIVNIILDELPDNATIPNGAVRTLRAQQATSSPSHFVDNLWGAKFEWFKMLLEDTGSAKIVVFSKFATAIKELQKYLNKNKVSCNLYYGEMSSVEREESKYEFIADDSIRVFAGTVACMGEGVDGLQKASHIVVFLDRPYSPEIVNQCEDRLNRPGQQEEVLCYFLECRGTYDRHYGHVNETRADDIRRALQYDDSDT